MSSLDMIMDYRDNGNMLSKIQGISISQEETSIENVSLRKASVSSEETAGSTMGEGRELLADQ